MKYRVGVGGFVINKEDKKWVNKVLDSSRLSYGSMTRTLERNFANYHDSDYAIFTNSGTSCLHIAVAALKEYYGWKDGDEIIVPSVTFVATVNVILHNNLKPIFVDADSSTFNIDPNLIEEKITERTRAIMPVHLLGLPADMTRIMSIATHYGLRVIEDSAETMFAAHHNRTVGSFGDIGCFSTYVAHFIVTGVGGFCTTSNPELAIIMRSLANHGRDSIYINIDDNSGIRSRQREIISRRFKFVRIGHSFRCTEMEAALGISQLKRRKSIIKRRKEVADMYVLGLSDLCDYLQFQCAPDKTENVYMLFGIVIKKGNKQELVNYLESNGIETRDLLPLINQPIYKEYFKNRNEYPVADELDRNGFYIGCHQYLSDDDVKYVIEKFHEYYRFAI